VANERRKGIIKALKAAAPEWTFEHNNFVKGRRGQSIRVGPHTNNARSTLKFSLFHQLQKGQPMKTVPITM